MSKSVKFGTYTCENNELDKTDYITWIASGTQSGYNSAEMLNTDILNPILKVDSSSARLAATYCKILDFSRFYFIRSIETTTAGHLIVHCHVDVLHTYRTGIGNMECLVTRNEDKSLMAKEVVDTCMILDKNRGYRNRGFGDSLITNEVCYVIGVI